MPRCFTAAYTTYYRFKVPKGIFLLGEDEDEKQGTNVPGSWWVKWGVFHYIDKSGKEIEIEGVEYSDHKWPESLDEEDAEESDDESEESDDESDEEEEPLEGCEQPYPEVKEPLSTS